MLKFIHAADFHLDSAFAALPPEKAAERRREQRELPGRLAEAVRTWGAELVLLSGDLFDAKPYPETVEAVKAALAEMAVPVFLTPGNHDFYGPDSPYAGDWPGNVHIFRTSRMESVPLPELGITVHGAAFLAPTQEEGLLRGFTAPEDGTVHIGVLHGELGETPSPGRTSPPAALPTWPWATSISGRSRCASAGPPRPGPAARRAGASTSWGRRASTPAFCRTAS